MTIWICFCNHTILCFTTSTLDVETSPKREKKSWRTALWDAAEAPWGWLRSEAPPKTPAGPRQFGWKKRLQSRGHGDLAGFEQWTTTTESSYSEKKPWVQFFRDLGPKNPRTNLKKHIWWSCLRLGLFSRFDAVFLFIEFTYDLWWLGPKMSQGSMWIACSWSKLLGAFETSFWLPSTCAPFNTESLASTQIACHLFRTKKHTW